MLKRSDRADVSTPRIAEADQFHPPPDKHNNGLPRTTCLAMGCGRGALLGRGEKLVILDGTRSSSLVSSVV